LRRELLRPQCGALLLLLEAWMLLLEAWMLEAWMLEGATQLLRMLRMMLHVL
jgi:hypothetical protein